MARILLVTSNGTGMGHLTRQAAVALAFDPDHETTVFSLSPGVGAVSRLGIRSEYCPSYDRPWIAASDWDSYLRDRLVAIARETKAQALIFDGVAPYAGIGLASEALKATAFIWLRRGLWKSSVGSRHLAKSSYFDLVIQPGDLADEADRGVTTTVRGALPVQPISMLSVVDPIDRDQARRFLGLPRAVPIVLVTLGSGMLGDVSGPGGVALDAILRETDWHVAVTRPSVAQSAVPLLDSPRVHEIAGVYPLVRYLRAFDAAVSSAGYNAVHELIPAGLPVALIANSSTRTDNQTLRANHLASKGMAIGAVDTDLPGVEHAVRQLMNEELRASLRLAASNTVNKIDGAREVASAVLQFVSDFDENPDRGIHVPGIKKLLLRMLGEKGVQRVKRLIGRIPATRGGRRVEVILTDDVLPISTGDQLNLGFTHEMPDNIASMQFPFEHLLPDSSEAYRQTRLSLVNTYYDVGPQWS